MFERALLVLVLSCSSLSLSRLYLFSLTVYLFSVLLINFHGVGTAEGDVRGPLPLTTFRRKNFFGPNLHLDFGGSFWITPERICKSNRRHTSNASVTALLVIAKVEEQCNRRTA